MADNYSIKFNNGSTSFEVQGPNDTWVDTKVSELKELMETMPVTQPVSDGPKAPTQAKKTAKKTTNKSTVQKTGNAKSQLEDKWTDDLASKILAYVAERQGGFDKGVTKQAAILAVYLKDNEGINAINPQDMELIYRKLSWPTIKHLNQLDNARARDKFFEKTAAGYELIHAGTVYGRDTSKTIAKDKK
jgi:hypothetical protein